jgi:hypothetical protein
MLNTEEVRGEPPALASTLNHNAAGCSARFTAAMRQPFDEILLDTMVHDCESLAYFLTGITITVVPDDGRPDLGRELAETLTQMGESPGENGFRFGTVRQRRRALKSR